MFFFLRLSSIIISAEMVGSVAGDMNRRHPSSAGSDVLSAAPSYKLEPENPFRVVEIRSIIEDVLTDWLKGTNAIATDLTKSAALLSEIVKDSIKTKATIDRHKLIVQSYLYESVGQSVRICSKCLWDGNYDNYVTVERDIIVPVDNGGVRGNKGRNITIVVIVFGLFFE